MIEVMLMKVLGSGLSIWNHHLKNQYFEEWREITTKLRDEHARPYDERDQNVIDRLDFDLLQLAKRFTTEVGRQDTTLGCK